MSNPSQRIQEIFLQMVDLPPEERAAALDAACGSDAQLRQQVERLLEAHDEPDSYLDRGQDFEPTLDSDALKAGNKASSSDGPPEPQARYAATAGLSHRISAGMELGGRYVLKELIGEGGMGEVWIAKQTAPVRRKVAIKLIKRGMDSRAVLNRFEQERQALAMMDHPNIARVLDGGVSASGQPYFVMELVNGLPLTTFCDQAKLSPNERLELFVAVCQAVQHAHQKGIVHRDLKPANVLVTVIDGRPIPKVIDFGVAKAVGGKLTDESMSTQFGAVVGTLEYMSPEQAGYSGMDVDTRSDIYSLGVILYELLTGLRPLDAVRLKKSALAEMLRMIQEEEPTKPSTRLSTDASLPSAAAQRQMDPKRLMALLRGELDWVVMKCLEKQRDRRYETANALARDIQCYLANEPVEARPPSSVYRLQKFLTRHRLPVTAAALILVSLLVGFGGTTWGWLEARRQREFAEDRRQEADTARESERRRAESEREARLEANERRVEAERQTELAETRLQQVEAAQQKAEQERAIAQAIQEFLRFKLLRQADVEEQANSLLTAGGRVADAKENPTIRELLDRAATELSEEKINQQFPNQPRVQAELLQTLGSSYNAVGAYRQAIPLLERALAIHDSLLGPEHEATLGSMTSLAIATVNAGDLKRAVSLFESVRQRSQLAFGPEHRNTLAAMGNLAGAYQEAGRLAEGLELYRETQRLREKLCEPGDLEILIGKSELAASYNNARQHEPALAIFEEVLPQLQQRLGPVHPKTLTCLNNLATCYGALEMPEKALALHKENHPQVVAKFGLDHPMALLSQTNMAGAYARVGDLEQASELLAETIQRATARYGVEHPLTLHAMTGLADVNRQRGDLEQAVRLQSQALALYQQTFGPNHPETILTESNLASIYAEMQRSEESLQLFQQVLEKRTTLYGPEHPLTLQALEDVGANQVALGHVDEGRSMLETAFAHASDDPQLLDIVLRLATQDFAEGRGEDGLRRLEEALPQYVALRGPDHRATLKCLGWIATAHFKLREIDQATSLFEDLLPRQTARLGPNDPDTIETLKNLAVNYGAQGRLPESLDRFRQVFERCSERHPPDFPKYLATAIATCLGRLRRGETEFALSLADVILAKTPPETIHDASQFANFVGTIASIHLRQKNEPQAIAVLEQGLALLKQVESPLSAETLRLMDLLGVTCWRQREFDKAIGAYKEALEIREQQFGRTNVETVRTLANLGTNLKDSGQIEQALPLLEEAYRASSSQPAVKWVGFTLLDAYAMLDRPEPAKVLASALLTDTREALSKDDRKRIEQTAAIVMALLKLKLFAEAEPAARELLEIREELQPENWSTFNSMSMLGGCLLGQAKFAEAEPLLVQGYEGMKAREESIPEPGRPRIAEALTRLVKLYEATDQLEMAQRFADELSRFEGLDPSE